MLFSCIWGVLLRSGICGGWFLGISSVPVLLGAGLVEEKAKNILEVRNDKT